MKKSNIKYKICQTFAFFFLLFAIPVHAIYNPLEVPNNRVGVHIFDPSEIFQASLLVNSTGGDWGYVTVPIRSDDRDYFKWEAFFKACREFHLIPIVRLATYPNQSHWVSPTPLDIIDFSNFLSLMPWPIQNRYIILFNEPNHSNEWGGEIDPEYYTRLLKFAFQTFKESSNDFFILNAGLDMSAPSNRTSIDALTYYRRMFTEDENWTDYVDGFSFHPYPNPAFSASPFTSGRYGIRSYEYELSLLRRYGIKPKYLFFTETGTVKKSGFYASALTSVWRDPRIVAISPFVLYAGSGNFAPFSLLNIDRTPTNNYREILNLPKIAGNPKIAELPKNTPKPDFDSQPNLDQKPVKSFWKTLIDYIVQ